MERGQKEAGGVQRGGGQVAYRKEGCQEAKIILWVKKSHRLWEGGRGMPSSQMGGGWRDANKIREELACQVANGVLSINRQIGWWIVPSGQWG